jgi:two-component system, cell cycle sensor histidine kinase and response regulator CckA
MAGMSERAPNSFSNVVLIAEDEPIIRSLLSVLLERKGMRVLVAADGLEALAIYTEHCDEIGVVITDLNMPRLDGPGLVRRLAEFPHQPRIIVTSGLPEMINEMRRVWGREIVLLPKPYDANDLAQALERVGAVAAA